MQGRDTPSGSIPEKCRFQGVGEEWKNVHFTNKTHDGKRHPFVSLHVLHDEEGTEFFAYVDSEDMLCVEWLGDVVREGILHHGDGILLRFRFW